MKKILMLLALAISFVSAPFAYAIDASQGYGGVSMGFGGDIRTDAEKTDDDAWAEAVATKAGEEVEEAEDNDSFLGLGNLFSFGDSTFKIYAGYNVMDNIAIEGSYFSNLTTKYGSGSSMGVSAVYMLGDMLGDMMGGMAGDGTQVFVKAGMQSWEQSETVLYNADNTEVTAEKRDEALAEATRDTPDTAKLDAMSSGTKTTKGNSISFGAGAFFAVSDDITATVEVERLTFADEDDTSDSGVDMTLFSAGISYTF